MGENYIDVSGMCIMSGCTGTAGCYNAIRSGTGVLQETVAPVLHVDTTGSKLRNLFVPVLADSEVDTTGNRWDKVAVSTGMDTETAFSCETGSEETETTTEAVTVASDGDAETAETMVQPLSIPAGITYSMEQLNNYDFWSETVIQSIVLRMLPRRSWLRIRCYQKICILIPLRGV